MALLWVRQAARALEESCEVFRSSARWHERLAKILEEESPLTRIGLRLPAPPRKLTVLIWTGFCLVSTAGLGACSETLRWDWTLLPPWTSVATY